MHIDRTNENKRGSETFGSLLAYLDKPSVREKLALTDTGARLARNE